VHTARLLWKQCERTGVCCVWCGYSDTSSARQRLETHPLLLLLLLSLPLLWPLLPLLLPAAVITH